MATTAIQARERHEQLLQVRKEVNKAKEGLSGLSLGIIQTGHSLSDIIDAIRCLERAELALHRILGTPSA